MEENNYRDFLLEHLDFAILYISLHYPFTEQQVITHWDYLTKGDAYYPVYIQEIKTSYSPKFGLCFNKNVEWTNRLKMQWTGGIVGRPYCDYNFEPDDMPILSAMIPLDSHHAIKRDGVLIWEKAYDVYSTEEELSMVDTMPQYLMALEEYEQLPMDDFLRIYHRNIYEVLINTSIWEHTLKHVLTYDFVTSIIQTKNSLAVKDVQLTQLSEKPSMYHISAEELLIGIEDAMPKPPQIAFPDFHTFMEQMPPDHDKDPCYAAFNLYEYLWGDSNAGDNETLNTLAQNRETSVKKITQHMSCVHAFLEKGYPDVLRVMEIRDEQEANEIDEDDDDENDDDDDDDDRYDDYFNREQYSKYNGYNGWSDQAIDEAFEGDPEATWNVD